MILQISLHTLHNLTSVGSSEDNGVVAWENELPSYSKWTFPQWLGSEINTAISLGTLPGLTSAANTTELLSSILNMFWCQLSPHSNFAGSEARGKSLLCSSSQALQSLPIGDLDDTDWWFQKSSCVSLWQWNKERIPGIS